MNKHESAKGSIILAFASIIWGTAFVAQSVGMDYIEPITFLAARSFVGCAVLIPIWIVFDKMNQKQGKTVEKGNWLVGGAICGTFLFLASAAQQIGIQYTTTGEAGFLTAIYIVIVPVLSIFLGKKASAKVWVAVVIALIGAFFLSVKDGFSLSQGAPWMLASAFLFSLQILSIDKFAADAHPIRLSFIQFLVCGIWSVIFSFIFETPTVSGVLSAYVPILYCGIMSSGVAYTLQIVGQKLTQPTLASLCMSLESVFSAIAGWIVLGQVLNGQEILGCVLVFCAVIIAQLPSKKANKEVF